MQVGLCYTLSCQRTVAVPVAGTTLRKPVPIISNVISQYDYNYDSAGRRIACAHTGAAFAKADTIGYAYNDKSELTNAVAVADATYTYAYDFDDIGNRNWSSERGTNTTYAANELNQYTAIDADTSVLFVSPCETFTPFFDADGNQTLVKTATGIWQVTYNGENRPIRWENLSNPSSVSNLITMSYDRMGRRVTKNDQRFVYDGYLCIEKLETSTPIHYNLSPIHCYVWDPTEPVATRPLVWFNSALDTLHSALYYTHDGNKNVSEVIANNVSIAAHYEYAPFGAVTAQSGNSAAANPWRFSSESFDVLLGVTYYINRYVNSLSGNWLTRDRLMETTGVNLYAYALNNAINSVDVRGDDVYLKRRWVHESICVDIWTLKDDVIECIDKGCPKENLWDRNGQLCIEFAWVNFKVGINPGADDWLGWESKVLPTGIQLTGTVIQDFASAKHGFVEKTKKTTVAQDQAFLSKLTGLVGKTALYSLARHNCRMFAQNLFEDAPGEVK